MTTSLSIMLEPSLVSIICGGLNFMSSRKHLLNTLLSLEFIMLSIFYYLFSFFKYIMWNLLSLIPSNTYCMRGGASPGSAWISSSNPRQRPI